MRPLGVRYLIWSQVVLFGLLIVCTALMPHYLFSTNEGGVSNYGVHARTVVFYTLAFFLSAVFVILASRQVDVTRKINLRFTYGLYGLAFCMLFTLFSTYPYKVNNFYQNIHILSVFVLFCYESLFATWLALSIVRTTNARILLLIEYIGFILGVLTFLGSLHVLFISQILVGGGTGLLAIAASRQLKHPH